MQSALPKGGTQTVESSTASPRYVSLREERDASLPRRRVILLSFAFVMLSEFAFGQDDEEQPDPVILSIAVSDAKITLGQAVRTAQSFGRPISAKFGFPNGLQFLVYVDTGNAFTEVVVDHKTGAMLSRKAISTFTDRPDASEQKAAMAKSKVSLPIVIQEATEDNPRSRAISVAPELRNGHPFAIIKLLVEGRLLTVEKWLD